MKKTYDRRELNRQRYSNIRSLREAEDDDIELESDVTAALESGSDDFAVKMVDLINQAVELGLVSKDEIIDALKAEDEAEDEDEEEIEGEDEDEDEDEDEEVTEDEEMIEARIRNRAKRIAEARIRAKRIAEAKLRIKSR